jgi:rhodanese-related sulfurtransferase
MENAVRPADLKAVIERGGGPRILDVRRAADFDAGDAVIPDSDRRDPEQIDAWAATLDRSRPVVVYCVRGGSVSRGVAEALRERGIDARFLEGGIAAWREAGFPTVPKPTT